MEQPKKLLTALSAKPLMLVILMAFLPIGAYSVTVSPTNPYDDNTASIEFADATVKALCVANWDTDGDGELSYDEAAAITDLGQVFRNKSEITSFNELLYFTGLTTLSSEAFSYCTKLASIIIPANVNTIGNKSFYRCEALTSIILPNTVTTLGSRAFSQSGLTTLTIPKSVTSIGEFAFEDCRSLTSIIVDEENAFYDSRENSNTLIVGCINSFIPNTVTKIGDSAFSGCFNLPSITFPDGLISIGNNAFAGCQKLPSVTFPNSVTSIGNGAFSTCHSLTSITIPSSVTSIGSAAFTNCTSLTSIIVNNDNTVYDSRNNCNAIIRTEDNMLIAGCNYTVIPNSVTGIGNSVFTNCNLLTSITLSNNITSIGDGAFNGCYNLASFNIPSSVTSIGENAFFGTKWWWNQGNGVVYHDNWILGYRNEEPNGDYIILEGTKGIADGVFDSCSGLTSITFPNTIISIGNWAFYGCSGLNILSLPNSLTTIGNHAFESCDGLTSITLPNSLISIGEAAFESCAGLTSITIPSSVSSIGKWAFEYCFGLTEVVSLITEPFAIPNNCWIGVATGKIPLYVPAGCKTKYEATEGWNKFTNIVEIGGGEPEPYAVLSDQGQTVTFYYDNQKASRGGIDINNSYISYDSNSPYGTATTAVFDASFADYRPLSTAYWFMNCSSLTTINGIENLNTSNVMDMSCMFDNCSGLTSLDVSGFDTSNVTSMFIVFGNCSGLTSLDVSGFDTSNVTGMDSMFNGCSGLTSLNVSGIDTSNVTSMGSMFNGCSGLTSLDLSGFDTSNVTNMGWMFSSCSGLTSLDLSGFNTPNLEKVSGMFLGCSGLTSLDVSGFDTSNVKYMNTMFSGCSGLTSLDVSSFDTSNVTSMRSMFNGCSGLTTIFADEAKWSIASVTDGISMFYDCTSLVGGYGTVYDENHTDAEYARIDGGEAAPGYFTSKGTTPEPSGIAINATNFPDENFRQFVLDNCDTDDDTFLSNDEISAVHVIDVNNMEITDLKGIEYFTALVRLNCERNGLTTLDVSKNIALAHLDCMRNQLTALDLSNNTALTELFCGTNLINTLDVSKNTALTHLSCEYNQLTSLDVSNNTALNGLNFYGNKLTTIDLLKNTELKELWCGNNQLAALDVSQNTALTRIVCTNNQLTTIDLSRNTMLTEIHCSGNLLTALDTSNNTALKEFWCHNNQLSVLNLTKNTELISLSCSDNQLTALDVSSNTAMTSLSCDDNQLTALDVSKNTALTYLCISINSIKGAAMDVLIAGLTETGGTLYAIYPDYGNEQNVVTKSQVAAAKKKGWIIYKYDSGSWNWVEYEGSDPEMEPIDNGESIDFADEINEDTNLDGNVVGDIFYNISDEDGSYDAEEGCIVVTTPTDDETLSEMEGKDIFDEDFRDGFTGIVFKVAPGSGTIKVEAQTTGSMVLKVKIGSSDPITIELEEKQKVSFPYNVEEETYVYIYGGNNATQAKGMKKADANGELRIYGIEVFNNTAPTDINSVTPYRISNQNAVYDLQGRKIGTDMHETSPYKRGINIIRMSDGTTRKVVVR